MTSAYAKPDWREPTLAAPVRGGQRLLAAFLTTFDPPQSAVLLEDLLPQWLGLAGSPADEGTDKLRYFAELEDGLKRLRGRFTVVSSSGTQGQDGNGWIWNYITRLQVGFRAAAVQHAKLWMFHRASSDGQPQTLEVIVSSQNLTRQGLRDQVQAGWRCVVPLAAHPGRRKKESWGVLPQFVDELAQACGPGGARVVPYWQELLERAACPMEATFLASVPGRHPARPPRGQAAWGVAALRRLGGGDERTLTAMVPTIGNWQETDLRNWRLIAGLDDSSLRVAWIEKMHPWAGHWQLNAVTESAFGRAGIQWLRLPSPHGSRRWHSPLCEEHRHGDTRWSHAKLYEVGSTEGTQLLCTSANFSRAAWGDPLRDGTVVIDNFELGVAVPADAGISGWLAEQHFSRAICETEFEKPRDEPIAWMAAEWDGAMLRIQARTAAGAKLGDRVSVQVARSKQLYQRPLPAWRAGSARLDWTSREDGVPLRVQLTTTDGYTCEVAVEDLRPPETGEWLCDAGSEQQMQDAADQMLEERYDYFEESGAELPDGQGLGVAPTPAGASYAVAAYEDSRRRFAAVDHWAAVAAKADPQLLDGVIEDGERIERRWARVAAGTGRSDIRVSAAVAAEELAMRVKRQRGGR